MAAKIAKLDAQVRAASKKICADMEREEREFYAKK